MIYFSRTMNRLATLMNDKTAAARYAAAQVFSIIFVLFFLFCFFIFIFFFFSQIFNFLNDKFFQRAYSDTLHAHHWDASRGIFADANAHNETFRSPHVGYVSLFPLLLRVLAPEHPNTEAALKGYAKVLADPNQLW